MFDDFKDLIALLNKHKAKYLVVGGYAVGLHAQPRATKGLDILILPAAKNAQAVVRALQEFGAPLRTKADPQDADRTAARRPLSARDFKDADCWLMMGTPPVAVDILGRIPGITFASAWRNRVTHTVDEKRAITADFISRADLIAAKLASGRPQDLLDVQAVRQAHAAQKAIARGRPAPAAPQKRTSRKKRDSWQ